MSIQSFELGAKNSRNPRVALNLSCLIAGLGQIYCGCLRRGLLQLTLLSALLLAAIVVLGLQLPSSLVICTVIIIPVTILTVYSAYDARKLARQCRSDYRLKEYNCLQVYAAISFVSCALFVGFTLNLRENYLSVYRMVGHSMSQTLTEGQRFFVRKDVYRHADPKHNDLVAFSNPDNRQQVWVKRVIALSGDVLEIKSGELWINGKAIKEPNSIRQDTTNLPATTIPKNHCYVLGDHRARSKDSRHIGPIPLIALKGKVIGSR